MKFCCWMGGGFDKKYDVLSFGVYLAVVRRMTFILCSGSDFMHIDLKSKAALCYNMYQLHTKSGAITEIAIKTVTTIDVA